jgi:hypothetical protein
MQTDIFTQICDVNFVSQNIESSVKQLLNSELDYHSFDTYSSVGIETGHELEDEETAFDFQQGKRFFCSAQHPDRTSDLPTLLSNGYRALFSWD